MKTLEIKQFKGQETVKKNKQLTENATFYSKVKTFEGKLSCSHYVLKFPLLGTENYIAENKKISINPNSYIVTNPHSDIEGFVKSEFDIIGVCIGFTNSFLNDLAFSISQKMDLCLDNPFINNKSGLEFFTKKNRIESNELGTSINYIKQLLAKNTIDTILEENEFYQSLGEAILKNELNIHSKISKLPYARLATREEIYKRIDLMNQFIYDNYTENITLEEISKVACLSKYHAVRCYQKIEGISPYKKIISLRLQKSKELLNQGFGISEVSDLCGFTDYRNFSKLFKKQMGLKPSLYTSLKVS